VPLATLVFAWVVWAEGDRQIREVLSDPYDAGRVERPAR
jgi:hypothetical protein